MRTFKSAKEWAGLGTNETSLIWKLPASSRLVGSPFSLASVFDVLLGLQAQIGSDHAEAEPFPQTARTLQEKQEEKPIVSMVLVVCTITSPGRKGVLQQLGSL